MQYYELGEVIGRGAFGVLYRAVRKEDGQMFVIKKLWTMNMQKKDKDTVNSEIQILRQLNHPNVVKLIDYFDDDGLTCIVMEYCEAGDLS